MVMVHKVSLSATVLLLACIGCRAGSTVANNSSSPSIVSDDSDTTLPKLCKSIHQIKNISVMLDLTKKLREYFAERAQAIAENKIQPPSAMSTFMKSLNVMSPKRNCLRQAGAIMELEPIIKDTQRVCSRAHLDKIEAYRKKHIPGSLYRARPKVTQSFFVLYAGQVSIVCKQNLRKSLEAAERQLIGTEDFELITLLLKPPSDCETTTRKSALGDNQIMPDAGTQQQQQQAGNAGSGLEQAKDREAEEKKSLRCNALNALSEIKSIDQLVAMLGMDIQLNSKESDIEGGNPADGKSELGSIEEELSGSARQNLDKLRTICPKFQRIYSQNIMSIVRLSRMGFEPSFPRFEETCREDEMIQKWFGITVICESLLKEKRGSVEREAAGTPGQDRDLDAITLSPIDDKLTIGKYLPSRFSKLSSDLFKSIKRKLHIADDSVAARSLETIGRYIVIALAMTVTFFSAGWNSLV